jgi:hypothetical protein
MKRYRVCNVFLDTTRNIFRHPAKGQMKKVKKDIRASLILRYGEQNFDEKFARFMELEKPAISVIAEHTYLLEDICSSYVQGNLFSALTGACCLGERIFNDILFKVMGDFISSVHFKYMDGRGSVNDWGKAIKILSDWDLIDKETKEKYKELYKIRTDSVHFQKKDQDFAKMSLKAINIVNFIINKLFTIGPHRKDILIYFEVPGEIFIRKDAEKDPIVKAFFIPCSILVGPRYKTASGNKPGEFKIIDKEVYKEKEISDSQFVKLRDEFER